MVGAYVREADKIEDFLFHVERYSWEPVIDPYDKELEKLAALSTVQ